MKKTDTENVSIKLYAGTIVVVWTLVVAASLLWNLLQGKREVHSMARLQARVAHERDVLYRRWNTDHGGVYVPVSENAPPNPYLQVPYRDIPGPAGTQLTLVNPAYMTRQVHELAEQAYGIHGHITSLNPFRPENAPDPWEARALEAFEHGAEEFSSVEKIEGEPYMRLMRPLFTEKNCLKCHAEQGYELGDVRGGISVAIPMKPLWAVERARMFPVAAGHTAIWLVGIAVVGLGARRLGYQTAQRRKAQEALKESHRKLMELESLKEDLTNMVVHDMKNPVNNTMIALDMIKFYTEGELSEEQDEYFLMAQRNQFKLSEMIANLLEISKLESGRLSVEKADLDLEELLGRIVDRHNLMARKEGKIIRVLVHPDARKIHSDEKLLERILTNLLSNAVKHSYPGGEIHLEVSPAAGNNGITFSVTDYGEGIPEEFHQRIFEKFSRSERRQFGHRTDTGLGLAFCKFAVEALGGRIWVDSEQGKGSRFSFTLPDARRQEP